MAVEGFELTEREKGFGAVEVMSVGGGGGGGGAL
jgi:hypothetical protein